MQLLRLLIALIPFYISAAVSPYALEAAKQPIAFSIVREDSLLDQQLIQRYFPEESISMLMVASGGCTAAQLVAQSPLSSLTIVDPNPAQIALTKIKLQLLSLPTHKRMEILGYLPMAPEDRKMVTLALCNMLDIDPAVFGDIDTIAEKGLDAVGRYELVFEALREKLNHSAIEQLFACADTKEQIQFVASTSPFGIALDTALDEIMSQENLVAIFGEKATANRVQEFSRHFAERIRAYLAHHTAASSPWMAQLLLGDFHIAPLFPWLATKPVRPMPTVSYYHGFMNSALEKSEPNSYHVIHLSNILDWLSVEEAEETLRLAYRALKPGGVVIIRQLNSNLNIPELGKDFSWDAAMSQDFTQNERSFFYRNFLVGVKSRTVEAPRVVELAEQALKETPVIEGAFFKDLPVMDQQLFDHVQSQFFFAVDFFSRPMAAVVTRMPLHKDRIDIIHNIVDEHGDFSIERYHSNTFKQFLRTLGVADGYVDTLAPSPVVTMFNNTLMGAATHEDPMVALACLGIIEYAFADISALIAEQVIARGWVKKGELVHYNLHANIDKRHAEEFFKIIEPAVSEHKDKIMAGLRLGAYIFNRLYEDLYQEAQTAIV